MKCTVCGKDYRILYQCQDVFLSVCPEEHKTCVNCCLVTSESRPLRDQSGNVIPEKFLNKCHHCDRWGMYFIPSYHGVGLASSISGATVANLFGKNSNQNNNVSVPNTSTKRSREDAEIEDESARKRLKTSNGEKDELECCICFSKKPVGGFYVPGDKNGEFCFWKHVQCYECMKSSAKSTMKQDKKYKRASCPYCKRRYNYMLPLKTGYVRWINLKDDGPRRLKFRVIGYKTG